MYELRSAIAWSFWWISTALPSRLAARIRLALRLRVPSTWSVPGELLLRLRRHSWRVRFVLRCAPSPALHDSVGALKIWHCR